MSHPERDTRQIIVDTAERFFRDIGYQKTTVADIAKSLRMSPANVYRFFESKKAINEAVLERYKREQEEAIAAIAAEDRPAAGRLRDILMISHRLNAARFAGHARMQEMVCAAMEESWDAIIAHIERFDAVLRRVVADGIARGEFRPMEPADATGCIRTAMIRFMHPLLITQCECIPGPTPEKMIGFVLAALEARPPR
ncbi:TetR/AcrR family transcriptional regulator [Bosea sp. (in: a-proteobacteria)]|uniref:TetR/AcrR family transcriptional regulator n=1 Tax=Bosea sp. (in: a-proteobacteria) TaxID=1871050 RepID=UPI00260267FD|nr:TetR/AcrR family transcriptional regulator [Bosea sp. (in: a-proteobacteria)]MCO5090407.1 TetR family transcriptional regulator [Bosea sp. (in: a-proteobacteria)]